MYRRPWRPPPRRKWIGTLPSVAPTAVPQRTLTGVGT